MDHDKSWERKKVNGFVVTMTTVICSTLTAGYALDVLKGRTQLLNFFTLVFFIWAQQIVCLAAYNRNKSSNNFKYLALIGYTVAYCIAIFIRPTYFTYVFIFPVTLLYILYDDPVLVKIIGIGTGLLNAAKIVYQIRAGFTSQDDVTGYIVQAALVTLVCVGMYTVTRLHFQIYTEKVGQITSLHQESEEHKIQLTQMLDNFNQLFGDVGHSTSQIATGAKQIADGSQSLAQGSTEQAASVQELSASIHEIAEKTKANAEMASKAAILAGTIKNDAEKGSRQMDEMMTAVKDINQASQQISKVIKVIDDIAFQTNILALNAAVEAARAGQHGKGFAVVAEEVRNLASKSAEAAKETGNLIVNSTEKAELGSRIAGETAQSLSGIVEGINESNALITQIAQSSDEQTQGIIQINKGIDQVAQVVQQNSATAEESAAAAEEMSGQSAVLDELIAHFRLQDGARQPALPDGKY